MSSKIQVTSRGASLAVRIDGEKNLPWLLLSNSLATDHSLWDPQMAALTKIPLATLRNWEQGRTAPDPAARALFKLIASKPKDSARILQGV